MRTILESSYMPRILLQGGGGSPNLNSSKGVNRGFYGGAVYGLLRGIPGVQTK